jgi:hypothetical protein
MLDREDILEVIAQHKADYQRMEDTFKRAWRREARSGNDEQSRFWYENVEAVTHFKAAVASITLALNEMEKGVVDEIANRALDITNEHIRHHSAPITDLEV